MTPKYCTAVYNTMRQAFTTLKTYQNRNHLIFHRNNRQVYSRNMVFTLQSYLPGVRDCQPNADLES